MKSTIILLFLVQYTLSAPAIDDNKYSYDAQLDDGRIQFKSDLNEQSYSYRVETGDGQIKYESGRQEGDNLVVDGGYSYTGDKGFQQSVTYTADERGFRPVVRFGVAPGAGGPPGGVGGGAKGIDSALLAGLVGGGIAKRSHKLERIIEAVLFDDV